MAYTIEQLEAFSQTKPELRYLTEELIKYLAANPGGGGGTGYLVYTAILNQSGTDAPVANVLQNTLGGTVVWARDGAGSYTATLSNAFTENKTFLGDKIKYISVVDEDFLSIERNSVSEIGLDHFFVGEQVDDFTNFPVEIRVYP